jgi:hypothetical protein
MGFLACTSLPWGIRAAPFYIGSVPISGAESVGGGPCGGSGALTYMGTPKYC